MAELTKKIKINTNPVMTFFVYRIIRKRKPIKSKRQIRQAVKIKNKWNFGKVSNHTISSLVFSEFMEV